MEAADPHTFIGLDMVDGCKPTPKPVCVAFLDRNLVCRFETWEFDERGVGLFPGQLGAPGFVLAIDGPQGLAGSPDQKKRECERAGGVAGKSPYDFPLPEQIYSGLVTSSVRLFASLWQSGCFHLFGLPEAPAHKASLIEVYPGKAYRDLAKPRDIHLKRKRSSEGRGQRRWLLEEAGLDLRRADLPCEEHDQLDAALAAYTALLFASSKFTKQGITPSWDEHNKVLREGFIVYPDPNLQSHRLFLGKGSG